ncbi:hypothetical protein [Rhodospira trueperi]|uniref:Uncharacterized protein n=1 Tax=Rhodospira trueperi TaxID=69960 RepID=A0A1G7HKV2_9PROT|nr:hypothetical protein [Rhodospira trueperi]SDF00629.1 hypothetical protein SAMN05421720_1228 [Rhodospira trueperi]
MPNSNSNRPDDKASKIAKAAWICIQVAAAIATLTGCPANVGM